MIYMIYIINSIFELKTLFFPAQPTKWLDTPPNDSKWARVAAIGPFCRHNAARRIGQGGPQPTRPIHIAMKSMSLQGAHVSQPNHIATGIR